MCAARATNAQHRKVRACVGPRCRFPAACVVPVLTVCARRRTHSGQQYELLEWLAEVTFPMEARFADVGFARKAYASVIRRTLDYGVRPRFLPSSSPLPSSVR